MASELPEQDTLLLAGDWQRLSPWSLIFFLFSGLKRLLQQGIYALLPAVLVLRQSADSVYMLLAIGLLLLLVAVTAWVRYRRFCFRFLSDRLEVRQGLWQQQQTILHYQRIQNIAIATPWYYRPLRLVTLQVDSAGSASEEVELAAITEQQAEQIRQHLYSAQQGDSTVAAVAEPVPVSPALLHQASGRDLLCYALSNAGLFWVLVIIGPLLGSHAGRRWLESWEGQWLTELLAWSSSPLWPWLLFVLSVLLLMTLLVSGSVLLTLLRYFPYQLAHHGDRFVAVAGYLTRREQSVRRHKIQNLQLYRPWLQGWRQRTTIRCQQATDVPLPGEQGQRDGGLLVPAVPDRQVAGLLRALLPEAPAQPQPQDYQEVHARVWRAPFVLLSGFALLLLAWLVPQQGLLPTLLPVLLLLLLGYLLTRRRWRRWGLCQRQQHVFIRQGFIGYRVTLVALFRVQAVGLRQSPIQRWLGVADLQLVLASGALRVPSLPLAVAEEVADQALYHAARQRQGWI